MAILTSANAAQAIMKMVATQALEALVGRLILGNLVSRQWESTLASYGDVVNIPLPPVFTANQMGFSGTISPQTPSAGNAQLVLTNHPEASFELSDAVRILSTPNMVDLYLEPAVIAIAESVESSILNSYPLFINTAGGSAALGESAVDSAEGTLFSAKVPMSQRRNLVVSQSAFSSLRQTGRLTEFQTVGFQAGGPGVTSPIVSGKLPGAEGGDAMGADGMLKGAYVYRSQFVPFVSSLYQNLMFTKDALGLVVRKLPIAPPGMGVIQETVEYGGFSLRVSTSYQQSILGELVTVDCLYGTTAIRPEFAVVIQST
jgi:hypothetical protein